jgi:NADH-quinone oxidoreductase subunit A
MNALADGVFLKFGIYLLAVAVMLGVMVGASYILGSRKSGRADDYPFESGILPVHGTNIRFPSQFYLVAMLFVIFDLEMIFVFAWAVAVRAAGWSGYAAMVAFLGLLLVALAYLWRDGALEWGPRMRVRAGK